MDQSVDYIYYSNTEELFLPESLSLAARGAGVAAVPAELTVCYHAVSQQPKPPRTKQPKSVSSNSNSHHSLNQSRESLADGVTDVSVNSSATDSPSVHSTMEQDRAEPGEFDLEDPNLEEKLVNVLKAQGIFDQFRKDCLSDVDTKVMEPMSTRIFLFILV